MQDKWSRIDATKAVPAGTVQLGSRCALPHLFGFFEVVVAGEDDGQLLVITDEGWVRRMDLDVNVVVTGQPREGFEDMTDRIHEIECELINAAWGTGE